MKGYEERKGKEPLQEYTGNRRTTCNAAQSEVMTGRCLETAKEFLSDGSLPSVKCKKSSSVESYD